ncbi:MAG TPA: response regulator transcription factor [Sphingobacterium sp.]|nr:response regulator transcription factor [Sphingobacterium sp.]
MKKILIADDHSIVRLGASVIISQLYNDVDIMQAKTYQEVVDLLGINRFDLLLLDINMPGGNNIGIIKEVLSIQHDLKILVFSSYDETIYALRYIEAGAAGYLNKSTAMDELNLAIQTIKERGKYMSNTVKDLYVQKLTTNKSNMQAANPLHKLSNREMDVAKHLISGQGVLDVSTLLNLSPSTVSTYKSRIFDKLLVDNIPELIELFNLHLEE